MPAKNPAELHAIFEKAFNTRDLNAIISLYEPNAVFHSNNGGPIKGRDQIGGAISEYLTLHGLISLETVQVVESETLALLHSKWTLTPPNGEPMHGLSTEVARKQRDGSWLFAVDSPYTPEP